MRHRKALAAVLVVATIPSACALTRNDSTVTIRQTTFTPSTSNDEEPAPTSFVGSDRGAEPPVEYEEGSAYYEILESRDGASSGQESSLMMTTPQPVQDVEIRPEVPS